MQRPPRSSPLRIVAVSAMLVLVTAGCRSPFRAAAQSGNSTETIVMLRHGEKPASGLGQLSCKGLNRALALPDLLIGRYGKPDFIYVPNPSDQVKDHGTFYSYVRPLATMEPTAVRVGIPINTQIGYTQIDQLQKELTQPAYANSRIFVAWEHGYLYDFAQQFLKSYGDDASAVQPWPTTDFDSIYVFQLTQRDGKPHLDFRMDHENLDNSLSDTCPGATHQ